MAKTPRIEVRHWSSMLDEVAGHVEVDLLEAPAFGHRLAADRDQDLVGGDLASPCRPRSRPAARRPCVDRPLRLGAGQHLDAELAQPLGDRPRQLGIVVRQDARQRLDHGHLGAHLGEGGAELQPDIAAADHGQLLRHLVSASASVEEMTRPAERQERQLDRRRAGGDHDRLGADDLRAGLGLDLDGLAVAERRPAVRRSSPAPSSAARRRRCSAGRRCRPSRRWSSPRSSAGAATEMPSGAVAAGHVRDLLELVGRMDQRLGRDAADIEAGAARLRRPRRSPYRCRAGRRGWRRHSRPDRRR